MWKQKEGWHILRLAVKTTDVDFLIPIFYLIKIYPTSQCTLSVFGYMLNPVSSAFNIRSGSPRIFSFLVSVR